jgi:hypothetical protein
VHCRRWHGCQWWGIGRSVRSITTWPQMFHDVLSSPKNPCFGWPNLIVSGAFNIITSQISGTQTPFSWRTWVSSAHGHNIVVSLQSWWSSQVPKNDFPWFFIKLFPSVWSMIALNDLICPYIYYLIFMSLILSI